MLRIPVWNAIRGFPRPWIYEESPSDKLGYDPGN